MPIPVVPLAFGLVGAAVAVIRPKIVQILDRKKVAILGTQHVGKTTLLSLLVEASAGVGDGRSARGKFAGRFRLNLGGKSVDFRVRKDVRGDMRSKLAGAKQAFMGADFVWYLFRSDLIASRNLTYVDDVKRDLDTLKDWGDEAKSKAPRVVLVGTFADHSPLFTQDPEAFLRNVRAADPINLGRKKFAQPAEVVVGSLKSSSFEALVSELERVLV